MFRNLLAEMARFGIDKKTMAGLLELNVRTMNSRLAGRSEFTRKEMYAAKTIFCDTVPIDVLFEKAEDFPSVA